MLDRVLVPVTEELDALFAPYRETLTVGDVAELMGMTKQGIYLWLKDGVIPGYKVGTSWFILRDELKKTLRDGSNQRRPEQPTDIDLRGELEETLRDGAPETATPESSTSGDRKTHPGG